VNTGVSSAAGVLGSGVVATSTKTAAIVVGSGYLGSIAALGEFGGECGKMMLRVKPV